MLNPVGVEKVTELVLASATTTTKEANNQETGRDKKACREPRFFNRHGLFSSNDAALCSEQG
jgi:hypothetical protein